MEIKTTKQIIKEFNILHTPFNSEKYNELQNIKWVKVDDVRFEIHKKFGNILGSDETNKLLDKMFKELK